jgi:hypothetical protein
VNVSLPGPDAETALTSVGCRRLPKRRLADSGLAGQDKSVWKLPGPNVLAHLGELWVAPN